jgi:hypothetical protein
MKIFRKVRKSLIESGKFKKVLIYSVGELFLIILGILIAINLDQHNKAENEKAEVINKLLSIQDEVKGSIDWTTNSHIIQNNYRDSLIGLILNDELDSVDYINNPYLLKVISHTTKYSASSNSFKEFDTDPLLSKHFSELDAAFANVMGAEWWVKAYEKKMNSVVIENRKHLVKNTNWYYNYDKDTASVIRFHLSDEVYKNHVKWYQILLNSQAEFLNNYSGSLHNLDSLISLTLNKE